MKKLLSISLFLLAIVTAFPQAKPAKTPAEKAPTQKEMQEMMEDVQKELDNMSPEDKKMMDSMGVSLPAMNTLPDFTDMQLQEGATASLRIIPDKDAARIASISKTPLTNATLPAFLLATHNKVIAVLKPDANSTAEEIYKLIKAEHNSAVETGNTAAGLWMMGKPELAIYVIGKSCIDDPSNTNNMNNYGAMLAMAGAEQLSIPILNYVNKRSPANSTILNNLGQAWFGLGDIEKSEKYLDSTIRICASHPQANYTKSFIEESKGNTQGAVEAALASIKAGYTTEKENRLYKLGYELESKDIGWDKQMPQDPLGLEKFNWPDYPQNVEESEILEKKWHEFKNACADEIANLESQEEKLQDALNSIRQVRTQQLLKAGSKGQNGSLFPPLASKAMKKLGYLVDDRDGHLEFAMQQKNAALIQVMNSVDSLSQICGNSVKELNEKYEDKFGEGKSNPFGQACSDYNGVNELFLVNSNTLLRQTQTDYLNFLRRKLINQIYYDQYTKWPEEFEVEKVTAKIQWLSAISGQRVMFKDKSIYCIKSQDNEPGKFVLQDFDDVHCEYHSELKLPIGKINVDCSRVTSELDLKIIKLGLKQNMDKGTNEGSALDNFSDQFMSCSVEIGAGESAGFNGGVLKAEASIGVAMRAEFDRSGLTDVIVKTQAGVSVGTDIIEGGSQSGVGVSDLSVEAGVKGEISLVSGKSSVESTGILDGVFKK